MMRENEASCDERVVRVSVRVARDVGRGRERDSLSGSAQERGRGGGPRAGVRACTDAPRSRVYKVYRRAGAPGRCETRRPREVT